MTEISPKEFAERMKWIAENFGGDPEAAHGRADDLLCLVLKTLGYESGVDEFEKIVRWYA